MARIFNELKSHPVLAEHIFRLYHLSCARRVPYSIVARGNQTESESKTLEVVREIQCERAGAHIGSTLGGKIGDIAQLVERLTHDIQSAFPTSFPTLFYSPPTIIADTKRVSENKKRTKPLIY